MEENVPKQKQISELYSGHANYPGRPHYFRRIRMRLFILVAIASVVGSLVFSYWGTQSAFNPGPISQNHSRFANDCGACHADENRITSKLGKMMAFAPSKATIAEMDAACIQCHPGSRLHLPQAAGLLTRGFSDELTLVHATSCAECHREHVGRDRMALPSQKTCISCHNDAGALSRARSSVHLDHQSVAPTGISLSRTSAATSPKSTPQKISPAGENRKLQDGVVRFLTPERPANTLPAFASYETGHPGFAYEEAGVKDPTELKFNHQRHLGPNIPQVNGHQLTCTDCHQPGAEGAFMQPVKYDLHCKECHALKFQPGLPELEIPHRDADKVRFFLASLPVSFDLAWRARGVSDPVELQKKVQGEIGDLQQHFALGLSRSNDTLVLDKGSLDTLQKRIFFEGEREDARMGRPTGQQYLTACSKCHLFAKEKDANRAPQVLPPNMTERWIQHGPFTHLPHQHMDCTDCHTATRASSDTKDILLPGKALCVQCHRAPIKASAAVTTAPAGDPHPQATAQRLNGGVKWDCIDCHKFHARSDAQTVMDLLMPPKPTASPDTAAN